MRRVALTPHAPPSKRCFGMLKRPPVREVPGLQSVVAPRPASELIPFDARPRRRFGRASLEPVRINSAVAVAATGLAPRRPVPPEEERRLNRSRALPRDVELRSARSRRRRGSFATGKAKLTLEGDTLSVKLKARGLSPNLPHAAHIHGKEPSGDPQLPRRRSLRRRVSDSLIETADGLADYGPILVPPTTSGDTSPASGLALDRMPIAQDNGNPPSGATSRCRARSLTIWTKRRRACC